MCGEEQLEAIKCRDVWRGVKQRDVWRDVKQKDVQRDVKQKDVWRGVKHRDVWRGKGMCGKEQSETIQHRMCGEE